MLACGIFDNAHLALRWTTGHTRETFEADQLLVYAVTRALEIVSEASRRLPQDLRERRPELPWRAIMGAGNVYRHNYDDLESELVWDTVQRELEPLLTVIGDEISALK